MIMSLLFHVVSAWFVFLLPCFSTFKALSSRSEPEIEKWCMYWTIIGAVVGAEYLLEWTVSWFPFYWEIKTLFLLFLSVPQFQGSTWLYKSYVEPFLIRNESSLDAGIVAFQGDVLAFIQSKLIALWRVVWAIINKTPATSQTPNGSPNNQPISSPLDTARQLFSSYAPSVFGAFVRPPAQPNAAASSSFQVPVAGNVSQRSAHSAAPPENEDRMPFPEPSHLRTPPVGY